MWHHVHKLQIVQNKHTLIKELIREKMSPAKIVPISTLIVMSIEVRVCIFKTDQTVLKWCVIAFQELNSRAQGEVSIREALRELEVWGVGATFQFTDFQDSHGNLVKLIKEWKDLLNEVCFKL